MAALVQSYQQSGTVTMLQPRPASASGMLQPSQGQGGQSFGVSQQQRNSFYGTPSGLGGSSAYPGRSAPIQPYAFTATPSLTTPSNQWQQFQNSRASSSPSVPTARSLDQSGSGLGRPRHPASSSMTNLHSTPAMGYSSGGSRDDSDLPGSRRVAANPRPQSAYLTGSATQVTLAQAAPVKISPERYRRPSARTTDSSGSFQQTPVQGSAPPSGSGMATVSHLYRSNSNNNLRSGAAEQKTKSSRSPALDNRPKSFYATATAPAAADDYPHVEAKRFRRRSMPTLDSADYPKQPLTPHLFKQPDDSSRPEQLAEPKTADKDIKTARVVVVKSASASAAGAMQSRNGSSDSLVSSHSSHSRPSSAARNTTTPPTPTGNPASPSSVTEQQSGAANKDYPRLVNIPPRGSSSDVANRVTNPSPLSKPVTMESATDAGAPSAASDVATGESAVTANAAAASPSSPVAVESPAVKQLSAISQKGGKRRGKSSRLRRAFSFGSAAEFRKAANPDEAGEGSSASGPAKLHKEPTAEELYDAEQARIAQKQEEAGIGNNIYAGARIFSGSTDNLSISSTASSASIMIRKMGRGMKKGTRSLVGLFRPKSVVGAPAADAQAPTEASQAAVSMITVEAERERVNVNPDPHTQHGGGTGFPRLERNSIDAARADSTVSERVGSSGTDNSGARKSIVGGEKERAEVLAAVRRGILKNSSGSSSPPRGTIDSKTAVFDAPNVSALTESPVSSAPSTPNDEAQGHKRTSPVAIGSEDYFMTALRLRQDTKSAPNTPQGTLKRNATFSPRIVFHDTWPSQEYDRRGEIATCNRLTPMLAQQIKEELNSFKMEMEVHENSKIYTHFF